MAVHDNLQIHRFAEIERVKRRGESYEGVGRKKNRDGHKDNSSAFSIGTYILNPLFPPGRDSRPVCKSRGGLYWIS